MKSSPASRSILLLLTGALLGAGVLWLIRDRDVAEAEGGDDGQVATTSAETEVSGDPISGLIASLGSERDPEQARQALADLRAELLSRPTDEAVDWIEQALATGTDQQTGLAFAIGSGGAMEGWPTLRTFLLDLMMEIDPQSAADASRSLLETPTSADEWALALRNVARAGDLAEDAEFLRVKTEELITNPEWQEDPSIGYLNAFDVLVHVEATKSTPLLSDLIQRKDRRDLAHAGFLTLDRLVQRESIEMMTRLSNDEALQASRPEMVSQQFARADVRDPGQRELLKEWLIDPARTPTELRAFAGVYPNQNKFISNNLLTEEEAIPADDLAAHDRAALQTVTEWAEDPAFAHVEDYIETMRGRLDGFVAARDGRSPNSPAPRQSPADPENDS